MLTKHYLTQVLSSDFKKTPVYFNWNFLTYSSAIRELKDRRFWAMDVKRKSRLLLFDVYFTLLIQKVKL